MDTSGEQRSPILRESMIPQDAETLKVGSLNVHLLPFDYVDGAKDLHKAIAIYNAFKIKFPDRNIVPVIEYFSPEIEAETGYVSSSESSDPNSLSSQMSEMKNIQASYGAFVNQIVGIDDKVLVVDPAYKGTFVVAEFLPILLGAVTPGVIARKGQKALDDAARAERVKKEAGVQLPREIPRRDILRGALGLGIALSAFNTFLNQLIEMPTGLIKSYDPPDIPGAVISEMDFRMLTIACAIEQLGQVTRATGIQDIVLVYPPHHIERIKSILEDGTASWIANNIKLDVYETLYKMLGIMNIREWTNTSTGWKKTNQFPINFVL